MTSTPRPDVAGIKARAKKASTERIAMTDMYLIPDHDIPALITYIETLEERMGKLEALWEAAEAFLTRVRNRPGGSLLGEEAKQLDAALTDTAPAPTQEPTVGEDDTPVQRSTTAELQKSRLE